jgi:hypothetical protein
MPIREFPPLRIIWSLWRDATTQVRLWNCHAEGENNVKHLMIWLIALFVSGLLGISESFAAAASSATQTVFGGGVTTKVTYLNPKGGDEPRFQVVLDTHSVVLDGYDLKTLFPRRLL